MIDRSLNYGRDCVGRFLKSASPFRTVLDLGAGGGDDLMLAQKAQPEARLMGVEAYPGM